VRYEAKLRTSASHKENLAGRLNAGHFGVSPRRRSMVGIAPLELNRLLRAPDVVDREAAWDELIRRHTRLLMAVARSFGGDRDDAMDRYSYVLEKLRELNFRRLRTYDPNAGASFPTWFTVTARHLCLDHHRSRFGRQREEHGSDHSTALRAVRRALSDLTEGDTPTDAIPDSSSIATDSVALRGELDECLRGALSLLTSRERLLLALRFEDDLPASRIAGILGMPTPFHVYRRLNSILSQLRLALEARGIEGSDG
jgi:RNA polymerase sigma factor (sigma-70 family)